MQSAPLTLSHVPRQATTLGTASLRIPFSDLLSQLASELAAGAASAVTREVDAEPDLSLLESVGLHADALDLSEFIAIESTEPPPATRNIADLNRLADTAMDLANEDGQWRNEPHVFHDIVESTVREIDGRIGSLRELGIAGINSAAIAANLNHAAMVMEDQLVSARRELAPWPPEMSDQLREIETSIRRWTRGRHLSDRLVLRILPNGPVWLLLRDAQRRQLSRMSRIVREAAVRRSAQEATRLKIRALELLIGRAGGGLVANHLVELDQSEQPVRAAVALLLDRIQPLQPDTANEILVCDSLDTPVDRSNGTNVRDVLLDRLNNAGFSASSWHQTIIEEGILFGNRRLRPAMWSQQSAQEIAAALLRCTERMLGSDTPTQQLDLDSPSTLVEHLAGISIVDSAFDPLLRIAIPAWFQKSRPYANFDFVQGTYCQTKAFLFCHPVDRTVWLRRLANQVEFVDENSSADYRCSDRFTATLLQFVQGAPMGAMRELKRWSAKGNENCRLGLTTPLFDRTGYPELRLLECRVKDTEDCNQLFEAALKCVAISPLASDDRFVLNRFEPRLEALFREVRVIRLWREAAFFDNLIRQGSTFLSFLRHQHPNLLNLPKLFRELSGETDPEATCQQLTSQGVLEEQASQYRLAAAPNCRWNDIPDGLCKLVGGQQQGLSRRQMVSAMMNRDRLYNVIFWAVLDAWQRGSLSRNDVPDSIALESMRILGT